MQYNYTKICKELLAGLPDKQREVLERRFNLYGKNVENNNFKGETLELIGKHFNITRERVRQIERDAFLKLKLKIKKYQKVFEYFTSEIEEAGGLKKEDILLERLGGQKEKAQIFFLLHLGTNFERIGENEDFYTLWTIDKKSLEVAKKVIENFKSQFKKIKTPLNLASLNTLNSLSATVKESFLEISKDVAKNTEGLYGLKEWPEINPKGIKDKAYLILKKKGEPLHFVDVANSIKASFATLNTSSNVQTVHNELIKDSRFVLVGRGMYALKEWGYVPGYVRDVICKVLKDEGKPLSKEDVVKKVSAQRMVKENTILLNLSNRKHFLRTNEGKYSINES